MMIFLASAIYWIESHRPTRCRQIRARV